MDSGTIVAIIVASFSGMSTIATLIWAASRAKTSAEATNERLGGALDQLNDNVGQLTSEIRKLEERHQSHAVRLSVLETVSKFTRHDCGEGECKHD